MNKKSRSGQLKSTSRWSTNNVANQVREIPKGSAINSSIDNDSKFKLGIILVLVANEHWKDCQWCGPSDKDWQLNCGMKTDWRQLSNGYGEFA